MKYVVDSNCLQSDELTSFLEKSNNNFAVLPDFVSMEAYKGNVHRSMEVLSKFVNQVIILKNSPTVSNLCGRPKGLQRRLIDESQTRGFPSFIKGLSFAEESLRMKNQLLAHRLAARNHFDHMLTDAEAIKSEIDSLVSLFTKDEKIIIKQNEPYTSQMVRKLGKAVVTISGLMFRNTPQLNRIPTYEHLPNTFCFRVSLCCYLMTIRRGSLGGTRDARVDRIRNDMVDMIIVAYATYFDGILSKETNVNRTFEDACIILSGLFGAVVPSLARYGIK